MLVSVMRSHAVPGGLLWYKLKVHNQPQTSKAVITLGVAAHTAFHMIYYAGAI